VGNRVGGRLIEPARVTVAVVILRSGEAATKPVLSEGLRPESNGNLAVAVALVSLLFNPESAVVLWGLPEAGKPGGLA